jgi:hypothetical protein
LNLTQFRSINQSINHSLLTENDLIRLQRALFLPGLEQRIHKSTIGIERRQLHHLIDLFNFETSETVVICQRDGGDLKGQKGDIPSQPKSINPKDTNLNLQGCEYNHPQSSSGVGVLANESNRSQRHFSLRTHAYVHG